MPKSTSAAILHRAVAYGKHLSIKGWGARSVIFAAVSVFVLAACEPAEPAPVDVPPIEASQADEPKFEWVRAMSDPRPAFKREDRVSSKPSESDSSVKEDPEKEIWCVPGCLLTANPDGSPVVPDWCTAWTRLTETHFARDSDSDPLDETNSVVVFEPKASQSGFESFACTRINLTRLSTTAADPNWKSGIEGELPSSFSHHTIDGLPIGMECSPGCAISWEEYGLKESDIGEFYGKNVQLPDWCAAGSKGCGPVDSNIKPTCNPENIANSMCTRLRFNDVPYSDRIVGVRDVE